MAKISLRVINGDVVRQGLEDLAADVPKIGRRRLRTTAERVKRRMQEYPPEPEGQSTASPHSVLGTVYRRTKGRYRRTGNYGRSWVIDQRNDGYSITNNAKRRGRGYSVYVGGDSEGKRQARVHQGRWPLFRTVVDEEMLRLPPEIENDITSSARKRRIM